MNAKKRALGRGLSALLDQSGMEPQPTYDVGKDFMPTGTIGKVSIDLIETNPHQPRTDFDQNALEELAASIREQGVIQPITLRMVANNKLQLISGERRLKASKMAGLSDIPAYIILADEDRVLEMAIVENIQRENLNPIEIALGYHQLIGHHELTQEMLSERLGKRRSSIANYLRLLKLPGDIQIGLRQELISMGHAKALLSVENTQTQLEVYQDILAQQLSVREVEEIVKGLADQDERENNSPEKGAKAKTKPSVRVQEMEAALKSLFGTRVQVKQKANGKGSITFSFQSQEEMDELSLRFKQLQ